MSYVPDEVSYSDYRAACKHLADVAAQMQVAEPDEAATHWLPELTRLTALIFNFVGNNMTARHVPRYARTVAELEAAKSGRLSPTDSREGR